MRHANEFCLFGMANFGYELSAANRAKVLIEQGLQGLDWHA
jgi:hypothetical protein